VALESTFFLKHSELNVQDCFRLAKLPRHRLLVGATSRNRTWSSVRFDGVLTNAMLWGQIGCELSADSHTFTLSLHRAVDWRNYVNPITPKQHWKTLARRRGFEPPL